jgi:cytoskeleton protein RodZ
MSDPEPRDLGERFRAAREARGLSLSEAAEQIRIRSVYLAALEEENWSAVGAPVYVRGFLRTYARFLAIEPGEAIAAFNRTLPEAPATPAADQERAGARSPRRIGLLIWVASAVAVLLIAFVVFNELTLHRDQAGVTPVAAQSPSAAVTQPATAAPSATPAPLVGSGDKTLALVLSAPSWLRVTVDGNVSMEGTFPAGTSKTFHGKNALVRIGNAGGVEIYVDGKDRGKLGKAGDVAEQAFTL